MASGTPRPDRRWQLATLAPLTKLRVSPESKHALAVDELQNLYLFDPLGVLAAQTKLDAPIVDAAISGDGRAIVVATFAGKLLWLDRQFQVRRSDQVQQPVGVAVDAHGWYAAVALANTTLVLDCYGRECHRLRSPRPLTHMAFVADSSEIVASSSYGLLARYGLDGEATWSHNLASRVSAAAVDATGKRIALAAFAQGLLRFDGRGEAIGSLQNIEMPSAVDLSADGRWIFTASLRQQLSLLTFLGDVVWQESSDGPIVDVALDPLARWGWYALETGRVGCLDFTPVVSAVPGG